MIITPVGATRSPDSVPESMHKPGRGLCSVYRAVSVPYLYMRAQIATARLNSTASISSVFPDAEHLCPGRATSSDLLKMGLLNR